MESTPAFRVTHLADAADELGCGLGAGAGNLVWLGKPGAIAIGRVFGVRQRAITLADGAEPPPLRHREVVASLAAPGDLVIIDVEGDTVGATWGEAHTLRAMNRGLAGVLVNGLTRDIDSLRERGFPVLCRGASPFRSVGRLETVDIACDLNVMGVHIRHGDTLAIDADGFIRIPADRAEAVLARARDIALYEQERDRKLGAR